MKIALVRANKGKLFTIMSAGSWRSIDAKVAHAISDRNVPLSIERKWEQPEDIAKLAIATAEARLSKTYVPENERARPRWWKVEPEQGVTILANSLDAVHQGGFFQPDVRAKMRAVREHLGVNVSTFAAILGCSIAQVSRLENDKFDRMPSYMMIGRLRAFCAYAYIPLDDNLLY